MAIVPTELQDMTFDYLCDDFATLASCSLVCRAWLPSSRLYHFRSITLVLLTDRALKFLEHLEHSPIASSSIGGCVRNLTLDSKDYRRSLNGVDCSTFLTRLFARLTRVRSLDLALNFQILDEELITLIPACVSAVSTLRLEYVAFKDGYHFYDFVSAFPGLSSLILGWVSWNHGITGPSSNIVEPLSSPCDPATYVPGLRGSNDSTSLRNLLSNIRAEHLYITGDTLNEFSSHSLRPRDITAIRCRHSHDQQFETPPSMGRRHTKSIQITELFQWNISCLKIIFKNVQFPQLQTITLVFKAIIINSSDLDEWFDICVAFMGTRIPPPGEQHCHSFEICMKPRVSWENWERNFPEGAQAFADHLAARFLKGTPEGSRLTLDIHDLPGVSKQVVYGYPKVSSAFNASN